MNRVLQVFRYEHYRTSRNVIRVLSLFLTIGLFFGFAWGFFNLASESIFQDPPRIPSEDIPADFRETQRITYGQRVEYFDRLIAEAELIGAPDSVRNAYVIERDLYQFYLDTGTIQHDYVDPMQLLTPDQTVRGESFAFMVLTVFRYVLYAYAVFLGASSFAMEYRSGMMRTLVAAPLRRRDILLGKLLFVTLESAIAVAMTGIVAWVIASIYGIGSVPVLVQTATAFVSVSAFSLFLVRLVSVWIGMVFFLALSATIGILLRQVLPAILIPAGFFFAVAALYGVILTSDLIEYDHVDPERLADGFPLLALDLHFQGWNLDFTLAVLIHLGMAAGLILIAHTAFKQQNV